jgi:hypothetical protein
MVFRIEEGKNFAVSQTQTVWQTKARKKLSARLCQTFLGQFFKSFADTLEKWWRLAPLISSHIESTDLATDLAFLISERHYQIIV